MKVFARPWCISKTSEPVSSTAKLQWLPVWRAMGWLAILAIVFLSLMTEPPPVPGNDKTHHFLAYFGIMLLFSQWHPVGKHHILALAFITLGCAIECIQPLTGRYFSWLDMLANASGVFIAWLIARGPAGRMLAVIEGKLMRLFGKRAAG